MDTRLEDIHLLKSLLNGEEQAFTYIFNMYYQALVDYAWRIMKDANMSQDVVQSVFCKLYENHNNISVNTSIKSYLYKSVYNKCINEIRHKKISNGYVDHKIMDFYFEEIIQTPEAEMDLQYKELKSYIDDAVSRLPERCRMVYEMKHYDDMSNREIADRLNISIKTVEAQMTKALSRLHKELDWMLCLAAVSMYNIN